MQERSNRKTYLHDQKLKKQSEEENAAFGYYFYNFMSNYNYLKKEFSEIRQDWEPLIEKYSYRSQKMYL